MKTNASPRSLIAREIKTLLIEGDRTCPATGRIMDRLIHDLMFLGAGVSTPRGISDTRIKPSVLNQIAEFRISDSLHAQICDYLI